ncbi:MAG: aldolase/citrate lyase family protein [Alphaproteobacteria bacterium]
MRSCTLTQAGAAVGRKQIGLEVIIESAAGLEHVESICAASPRMQTVHFGAADYAASAGMRTTNIGGSNADYTVLTDADASGKRAAHWGDLWHYRCGSSPLRVSTASSPSTRPFGNYSDPDRFRSQAMRTAVMGFEGKWAIHRTSRSRQRRYHSTPPPRLKGRKAFLEGDGRRKLPEARGAVTYRVASMIDASIRQAEVIVAKMRRIARA